MALLTRINGIPLYSTVNEALAYAEAEGLQGYHTHRYKNIVGYMGGVTHEKSRQSSGSLIAAQPTQQVQSVAQPIQVSQPVQQPIQQQPTYTPPSTGGGGY
tara:strand:- start:361 stop:663 length:303 start_codon:yes stop_codon:yes gene_type:complete